MRITALLENTAATDTILAEHGLSLYIETTTQTILADMGQTDCFARNAETLGLDLNKVDIAVLSHGHYDHGGGLTAFLAVNDHAPVYVHRHAFEPHFNGTEKYIGLSPTLADNQRLRFVSGTTVIQDGITLYDMNDQPRPHDLGAFGLTVKENDQWIPDDFRHEHYLLIEEAGKRVLISGCSHKGIVDIIDWFDPDVMIGGFHLSKLTDNQQLDDIAKALNNHHTAYYTCHCTGEAVYAYLRERMDRLHYIAGGDQLEI